MANSLTINVSKINQRSCKDLLGIMIAEYKFIFMTEKIHSIFTNMRCLFFFSIMNLLSINIGGKKKNLCL